MKLEKLIDFSQYMLYYGIGILVTVFFFKHEMFYHFPPDISRGVELNWMAVNVGAFLFTIVMVVLENAFEVDDRHWVRKKLER